MTAPKLTGDALKAVLHRGSHLQIIAAAGSGKTEVVSQRVVALLGEGVPARGIVAFTFTERAAAELKERIADRVEETLGRSALDQLNGHVRRHHPRLLLPAASGPTSRATGPSTSSTRTVTRASSSREANRLGLSNLGPTTASSPRSRLFAQTVDVVDNELLDPWTSPAPVWSESTHGLPGTRSSATTAQLRPADHRAGRSRRSKTTGHPRARARAAAPHRRRIPGHQPGPGAADRDPRPQTGAALRGRRRRPVHLPVARLGRPTSWSSPPGGTRGSRSTSTTNRRSTPGSSDTANAFVPSIPDRLPKEMGASRSAAPGGPAVVAWAAEYEMDEAGHIANAILDLNEAGVPLP